MLVCGGAGLRGGKDTLDRPSINHASQANDMAAGASVAADDTPIS